MRTARFGLLPSVLLFFTPVWAQQFQQAVTPSPTLIRDPQAVALAARALAAMGANSVSPQIDSRAIAMLTISSKPPLTMNLVLESKGLTTKRAELRQPSGLSIRIVRGGAGSIQQPDGSVRQVLRNNTLFEHVNYIPILSLLAEFQNPAADLEIVSRAASNGTADEVISVALGQSSDPAQAAIERQISRTVFYINQASSMVDKIEYIQYSEQPRSTPLQIQEVYSDYRNVGGVAVPFHQTTLLDGQIESDIQVSNIAFNVGLSDTDFIVPGGPR